MRSAECGMRNDRAELPWGECEMRNAECGVAAGRESKAAQSHPKPSHSHIKARCMRGDCGALAGSARV